MASEVQGPMSKVGSRSPTEKYGPSGLQQGRFGVGCGQQQNQIGEPLP